MVKRAFPVRFRHMWYWSSSKITGFFTGDHADAGGGEAFFPSGLFSIFVFCDEKALTLVDVRTTAKRREKQKEKTNRDKWVGEQG